MIKINALLIHVMKRQEHVHILKLTAMMILNAQLILATKLPDSVPMNLLFVTITMFAQLTTVMQAAVATILKLHVQHNHASQLNAIQFSIANIPPSPATMVMHALLIIVILLPEDVSLNPWSVTIMTFALLTLVLMESALLRK